MLGFVQGYVCLFVYVPFFKYSQCNSHTKISARRRIKNMRSRLPRFFCISPDFLTFPNKFRFCIMLRTNFVQPHTLFAKLVQITRKNITLLFRSYFLAFSQIRSFLRFAILNNSYLMVTKTTSLNISQSAGMDKSI